MDEASRIMDWSPGGHFSYYMLKLKIVLLLMIQCQCRLPPVFILPGELSHII